MCALVLLNIDGQQFHEYQENEQLPLSSIQQGNDIYRWRSRYARLM